MTPPTSTAASATELNAVNTTKIATWFPPRLHTSAKKGSMQRELVTGKQTQAKGSTFQTVTPGFPQTLPNKENQIKLCLNYPEKTPRR